MGQLNFLSQPRDSTLVSSQQAKTGMGQPRAYKLLSDEQAAIISKNHPAKSAMGNFH
jgi:hypothetical protein